MRYHGRVFVGGGIVGLTMAVLFSLSHWYPVSLPLLVALGFGASGFGTMQATIVMLVTRAEMRGRALGVVSLAIGAGPLGILAVGGIATATSPTFAVGVHAGVGVVALALVWLMMPSIRQRIVTDTEDASAPERARLEREASP